MKNKAKRIFVHRYQTGGGLPIDIFLSFLEEKLLQILGETTVFGIRIAELGLTNINLTNAKKVYQDIFKMYLTFFSFRSDRFGY